MKRWIILVPCLFFCACMNHVGSGPDFKACDILLSCTVDGEPFVIEGWSRSPANSRPVPSSFVLIPEAAYIDRAVVHALSASAGSYWSDGRTPAVIPWFDWIVIDRGPYFEATKGTVYLVQKGTDLPANSWTISILLDRLPVDIDADGLIKALSALKHRAIEFTGKNVPNQRLQGTPESVPSSSTDPEARRR